MKTAATSTAACSLLVVCFVASKDVGRFTVNAELGFSLPVGRERGGERGALVANLAGGWQVLPGSSPSSR